MSSWKPVTVWDCDRALEKGFAELEQELLPLQLSGLHCTGLPFLVASTVKPTVFALMS